MLNYELAEPYDMRVLAEPYDMRVLAEPYDMRVLAKPYDMRVLAELYNYETPNPPKLAFIKLNRITYIN